MAEAVVFPHALGLTGGVRAFAARLEKAGHTVHVPDLYEGRTFDSLEEGVAFAGRTGFGTLLERAREAARPLPRELVLIGFSLGVLPAQMLAQTRPGVRGALLVSACIPVAEFGGWPDGVPVQVHAMDADPVFTGEGDLDAARGLLAAAPEDAELFLYPGAAHLFADPGLPSYDPPAAALLTERVLTFLDEVG
jgi:dienelactone hydrolase